MEIDNGIVIKEVMAAWNMIENKAKSIYPNATAAEIYEIVKKKMDESIKKCGYLKEPIYPHKKA